MGRTKRLRFRKKYRNVPKYLNSEIDTVSFVKWMNTKNWINETKLRIAEFPGTGRGVLSLKSFNENDALIEVPLDLLITYKTLESNDLFNSFISHFKNKLTIHELLAIFILVEKHLGIESEWYNYLRYLPTNEDICLPWFCSTEEIDHLPEEVKNCTLECINNVEDSWKRISIILDSNCMCKHCKQDIRYLVTYDFYVWAYAIVNTRAVYIDPLEIRKMSGTSLEKYISDEPTMALCPYIDMFNHSSSVTVKAVLKTNEHMPKYCLYIGNKVDRYEEIFISYGAHDNKKLLCQYGFILPDNQFDTIEFTLKEILSVCRINANSRQYKFLCDHNFNTDISVNSIKFSFNMSAVLYVLTHERDLDWSLRVYTSTFTRDQLKLMYHLAEILLKWKLKQYEKELQNIVSKIVDYSKNFKLCIDYLKNRINFIKKIIEI